MVSTVKLVQAVGVTSALTESYFFVPLAARSLSFWCRAARPHVGIASTLNSPEGGTRRHK